jgi:ABC-type oligopeptide transport system substrate-binding subunit/class 3 adenylate cyclase
MTEREQLKQAITQLEAQRATLGDGVVDASIAALREKLEALERTPKQRKQVTILFADVSGYTALAETMDAEELSEVMNALWERIDAAIVENGGRIDKHSGDGVMALWGVEMVRESDPERAIRAALAMQAALAELKAGHDINMRIGLSTGPVLLGTLGTTGEFSIFGDTVNLASRLEGLAPTGGVLISHDTYQHVRGVFDVLEQAPIQVKGKAKPVQTYVVHRAKPRAFRMSTRGVAGIETRMVGRDAELLMLQNMFRDATEDGEAQLVTIVGEAGVGKSRLLYEFEKWIELLPEQVWRLEGRATPETEARPYGLIQRMFAHRFEILGSDSAAEMRAKFRAGMAASLDPDQADLVGQLIGLDFSASPAVQARLGSESFVELATAYLTEYLQVIASEPTVILLEDIHCADDSSLDLLDCLVTGAPDTRLLVVCLARPQLFERRPSWGEGRQTHTQINLKPLSRRASRALVEEILRKTGDIPHELRDLVVEGAEGNPFYVEELIKMLIEDGVIVIGENSWRVELERLATVHVPPTLTGVLQARLDSLPPEEKMLLQRAAVVGRLFWDTAVAQLKAKEGSGLDKEQVTALLEAVRNRDLVFRRERSAFAGAEEYIFQHTLLRDVTYETVLLNLRRVYHGQVARWLEAAAGKRIGEYLGLIAGHYELAGDGEKAVEYLLRAGDQARLAYACQEARGYYHRALPLLEAQSRLDQAARTLMKLGLTYELSFDFQGARQTYEQGFAMWQRAGDEQWEDPLPAPHPLRLNTTSPTTLDPTMAEDARSAAKISELFSGLVEQRLDLEVVPDVAQSWEVLEGGKQYIFHLREDVLWTDGKPVTAGDFEYAWKRVLDPGLGMPLASLLDDIKGARAFRQGQVPEPDSVGVKALDEFTLLVDLEGPTGYFLQLLANTITFPVPRHVVELHGESWSDPEHIVTCGPFRLEAWQPETQMILARNPDYPGRFRGNLEYVELLLTELEPDVSLEMYKGDQLDVVDVTAFEVDPIRQMHAGEYRRFPQLVTAYLQFDASRAPFDDVRVRLAFALATDREALVKAARPNCFPAMGGFVPPGMPGHLPGIGLPCNIKRARQLLAEVGYPGGLGFPVVECVARPDQADLGKNLQAQWEENLGVKIKWETVEWQAILARLGEQVPHLLIMGWMADYPDPDNFLRARIDHIQHQSGWRNAGYDSLVKQAQRSLDQGERIKLYGEAEQILVAETPIMPIFHTSVRLLVKPWVTRFPTTGLREWFLKDVIIKPH